MNKYKIEALGEPKTIQGAKGPFQVFGIKANGSWMNGYYNKESQQWKVGDEIELLITEKAGKDGKMYKNFSIPKKDDLLEDRVSKLEKGFETFRKEMEMKFAELKSDLVLQTTGKFSTDKDYKKAEETNYIPEPEF